MTAHGGRRAPDLRVLVVDDNVDSVELMVLLLDVDGLQAAGTSRTDEVDALALRMQPHVLITDLHMPGATGSDMARRVRALTPGVQVWLATGAGRDEVQPLLDGGDFERVLYKPLDLSTLIDELLALRP